MSYHTPGGGGGSRPGRAKPVCAVCQNSDPLQRAQLFVCTGCRQVRFVSSCCYHHTHLTTRPCESETS